MNVRTDKKVICNEFYNGQGLGNQLWNYAVTRVIADKNRYQFAILGRDKFKGKEFMSLNFGIKLKGGKSPEGGPPTSLPKGITNYYREEHTDLPGTKIDVSETDPNLLNLAAATKFDGNCQSTKYLTGYQEKIRKWLIIKSSYQKYVPPPNSCLIHVRGGDYTGIKDVFLPVSYYRQAMVLIKERNPAVKFFCVTDQKDLAQKILPGVEIIGSAPLGLADPNKASHHLGGPVGIDFCLMLKAKYLIISNSSFSWWAAYLNSVATYIIAPKYWAGFNKSEGYWSTSDIITDNFSYLDRNDGVFSATECRKEKSDYDHRNHKLGEPKMKFGFIKRMINQPAERIFKVWKSSNTPKETYISAEEVSCILARKERTDTQDKSNEKRLKIKIDYSRIRNTNLNKLIKYADPLYAHELIGKSGIQIYRLLAYLALQINKITIIDLGTYKGNSALALSINNKNKVISYDILNFLPGHVETLKNTKNIEFVIGDGCLDIHNLLKAKLIVLDVGPHDGFQETKLIKSLIDHHYSGLMVIDDIYWCPGIKNLWENIPLEKYDLTDVGHIAGTGLVNFSPETIQIILKKYRLT